MKRDLFDYVSVSILISKKRNSRDARFYREENEEQNECLFYVYVAARNSRRTL